MLFFCKCGSRLSDIRNWYYRGSDSTTRTGQHDTGLKWNVAAVAGAFSLNIAKLFYFGQRFIWQRTSYAKKIIDYCRDLNASSVT